MLHRRRTFDDVMDGDARWGELESRDRAFAYTLVATTLRRLGQIDDLLDGALRQPLPERDHLARNLLRLGVCQLVLLRTPAHAAVDTAVALGRRFRQGRYLGLFNAVLRRLAADGQARLASQDAARLNTPPWLWRSWSDAYGADACRRIAEAHLREPPLDLTAKDDAAALAIRLDAQRLPTGTVRLHVRGSPTTLAGFEDGGWWVQDAAAALPVRLLGDVRERRVIDLCAAPGGKTAQLAAAGARVTAVDRSPERADRLRRNLDRLRLCADVVIADAVDWRPAEPADAVLIDVPCSATGTIRRHPDVAWVRRDRDIQVLTRIQARLLAAAAMMVRPGGHVVYCACSLQPEEGPDQVAALARAEPSLTREPVTTADLTGLPESVSADGDLRTFPFMLAEAGGMDGFFAARWRRREP